MGAGMQVTLIGHQRLLRVEAAVEEEPANMQVLAAYLLEALEEVLEFLR